MVAGKSIDEIRKEVRLQDYNQSPARVITHVETAFDYLWRYRDVQTPVRAPQ